MKNLFTHTAEQLLERFEKRGEDTNVVCDKSLFSFVSWLDDNDLLHADKVIQYLDYCRSLETVKIHKDKLKKIFNSCYICRGQGEDFDERLCFERILEASGIKKEDLI